MRSRVRLSRGCCRKPCSRHGSSEAERRYCCWRQQTQVSLQGTQSRLLRVSSSLILSFSFSFDFEFAARASVHWLTTRRRYFERAPAVATRVGGNVGASPPGKLND